MLFRKQHNIFPLFYIFCNPKPMRVALAECEIARCSLEKSANVYIPYCQQHCKSNLEQLVSYVLGISFNKTLFMVFSNQMAHIHSCCSLTSSGKERKLFVNYCVMLHQTWAQRMRVGARRKHGSIMYKFVEDALFWLLVHAFYFCVYNFVQR